jgi:phosphate transport system permease protein
MSKKFKQRKITNGMMHFLLGLASFVALIPLISIFIYVLMQGVPGLSVNFFTRLPQPIGELGGGMANSILGTLSLIITASLVGVPWGIGAGLFLSEYPPGRLSAATRFSADLLSSIPSIIIGLFIYTLIVIPMRRFSLLAGGMALGIIMIPTLARSTEEMLRRVPVHVREAGLALGLPRWKVIFRIVLLGNARPISTGIILAIARISGETAPLLFTSFNNQFWQRGIDQPTSSLPIQIYTYAISPYEDWHRQAWAGALILVLLVFLMNITTRYLLSRRGSGS